VQFAATDTDMRISKTQLETWKAIRDGKPFYEFLTLGEFVPARLNYVLDGKRVGYRTFWKLFKFNLITKSRYKGDFSPQRGITQFYLTPRGAEVCQRKGLL
jgi:hypothetical protein